MEKGNLKTLNDIEIYVGTDNNGVSKSKLKAEAVKWVKRYKNDIIDHQDQIEFIKHFFNLTEEDLQ